jgi:2-polyprenyl-6-methoxyphenol hydroxylase-like FAD-dependent oxidoreductase
MMLYNKCLVCPFVLEQGTNMALEDAVELGRSIGK